MFCEKMRQLINSDKQIDEGGLTVQLGKIKENITPAVQSAFLCLFVNLIVFF